MAERHTLETTSYRPLKRILLEIAYDGTRYCGWQIQHHSPSVQQELQACLSRLHGGHEIQLVGSSRTDTGVHALGFAASYLVPERSEIPVDRLVEVINRQLVPDIRIRSAREVDLYFHARYDALGKAYTYVLNRGVDTPFNSRCAWRVGTSRRDGAVDANRIFAASRPLIGTHDFSSFVVERAMIDDAVRTIYRIEVREIDDFICITYIGNGFLYKMIRCLTGTLLMAGLGRIDREDVRRILESCDRTVAPETAPPHGLYLMKVFFEQSELESFVPDVRLPFQCV